ncbi:MAG: hypothetical protein QXH91_06005 [Candidatus Bathyarchaeia archaeon]
MGNFTAKLELPQFIPKEEILGKYVFDSEVVCIGLVEDWTYTPDGVVKMVVRVENGKNNGSTILIPFSYIDRGGQFVLLKAGREKFLGNMGQNTDKKDLKEEKERKPLNKELKHSDAAESPKQKIEDKDKKRQRRELLKGDERKYFTEIDEEKLNQLLKKLE